MHNTKPAFKMAEITIKLEET